MFSYSHPSARHECHQLQTLIQTSRLYRSSRDYKELLDFVTALPHISPLDGLLLQVQRPGLKLAASEAGWFEYHNRTITDGARPLIILWPFGPAAYVYDLEDTEGEPLPEDIRHPIRASGTITERATRSIIATFERQGHRLPLSIFR